MILFKEEKEKFKNYQRDKQFPPKEEGELEVLIQIRKCE